MRSFLFVQSTCGESGTFVDIFDLDLNYDGVTCCYNCRSIQASREAWYEVYGNPYKTDI